MAVMSKDRKKDRHRSGQMFRQDEDVMNLMRQLAEQGNRPLSREIRAALIAWLTTKGMWPPPSPPADSGGEAT